MKKFIITVLVAVTVSLSASSQAVQPALEKAISSFETKFINVSNVQWVSQENFTKALFRQDGRNFEAYYNPAGDFIAATNYVDVEDLPLFVKRTLERKYSDYKVQHAFELVADDNSVYFISAENDVNKLTLKVENGSISVYNKSTKKATDNNSNVMSGL